MRLFLFALVVSLMFFQCLFSQIYEYVPFQDSGVVWSEKYTFPENMSGNIEYSFERFALNGEDTLINSILYKKLYLFYDTIFNINTAIYVGGIREENKRVFYLGDTIHRLKPLSDNFHFEEIQIYDFNISLGDIIETGMGMDSFPCNYAGPIVVESIDTVLIGGVLRKKFIFQGINMSWIEGIGNTSGLLFVTTSFLPSFSPQNTLICYKENGDILYFNSTFPDCIPLINLEPESNKEKAKNIFPNPATDHLYLNCEENAEVEILNLQGQVIATCKIPANGSVDVSALKSGVYLMRIKTDNGLVTSKFVKQ